MNGALFFGFAAILIIGAVLFAMMSLSKGGGRRLDIEKYRVKWIAIERQLVRDQPASYQLSVLSADKLLDMALREKGYKGVTMAERLKAAGDVFGNKNALWSAHKLRNQVAHEPDAAVSYEAARGALASFKQALKDVGAI